MLKWWLVDFVMFYLSCTQIHTHTQIRPQFSRTTTKTAENFLHFFSLHFDEVNIQFLLRRVILTPKPSQNDRRATQIDRCSDNVCMRNYCRTEFPSKQFKLVIKTVKNERKWIVRVEKNRHRIGQNVVCGLVLEFHYTNIHNHLDFNFI